MAGNTLYTNDNLFILNGLNSEIADLIYLDPPFNSKRTYSAPIGSKAAGASFKDMWTWQDINDAYLEKLIDRHPSLVNFIKSIGELHSKDMMAYVVYMTQRIIELHRILKNRGSLYLHCDGTASHYLKLVLDEVFGKNNFRNEIAWCYRGAATASSHFPKKHDTIFLYSKTDNFTFNLQYQPHTEAQLKRYNIREEDGLYANMKGKLRKLGEGVRLMDWWEIPQISNNAKERTGYPTQKPLELLKRIILASSNLGDLVLDPFCGCATTCVAAQQLGRKWIGIDIEKKAVSVLVQRLSDDAGMFSDFINTDIVPHRTDVQIETPSQSIKERLFKEQAGLCNGCGVAFELRNFQIDHIVPKSKGGGDYYENYQLLCGNCNTVKGNRPMEYLRIKIAMRQKTLDERIVFGE